MLGVPILLAIASVSATLVFSIKNNMFSSGESNDVDEWEDVNIYDKFEIFPTIRQKDFYDHLRMESGKAIINEDMIANIIWHIMKGSKISSGDLEWEYELRENQELNISLKWITSTGKEYAKTYQFVVSQESE